MRILNSPRRVICFTLIVTSSAALYFVERPNAPAAIPTPRVSIDALPSTTFGSTSAPTNGGVANQKAGSASCSIPSRLELFNQRTATAEKSPSNEQWRFVRGVVLDPSEFRHQSGPNVNEPTNDGVDLTGEVLPIDGNVILERDVARKTIGFVDSQRQDPIPAVRTNARRRENPSMNNTSNPALIPSILVPPDPGVPLSDLQAAGWQKIEQDFVEQIGGPTQSPQDPEYRARWQSAQEISDAMFRQKFGIQAFLKYNVEAGRSQNSQ
jgi:hypothetical protein